MMSSSVRWGYLAPKLVVVLAVISVTVPRLIGGARGGTAAGPWITAVTGVAIAGVVIGAVSIRFATNRKLRSARDCLASSYPGGAFVVFKTDTASANVKSLKADAVAAGWRGGSRGAIVTVDEEEFIVWERRGRGAVPVLSVPWSTVLSVGVERVGAAELLMDAVVVRVRSGAIKVDLFFPPANGGRGLFIPAGAEAFEAMHAAFEDRLATARLATG